MLKRILYTGIMMVCCPGLKAQVDPHFSQYYAYPLWMNPGMTGVMDGDIRVTGIYRNQWSDVMTPYTTEGVSADVTTNKHLDIGINLLSQSSGDAGFRYMNGYLTLSYSGVRFGKDEAQQISIGIQAGLLSRSFDRSKFQFGDQWNPITGYNPGTPSADMINVTSSTVADVGAGLVYADGRVDQKVNLYAGAAVFHLTRPQDPFVEAGIKKFLPARYVFHGGARITLNDRASIIPNLLYMRQGTADEKMFGLTGQLRVNETTDLVAGVNYRFDDAVSPFAGVAYGNFMAGVSYDVTTSALGKTVHGTNSLEVSLTYTGRRAGKPLKYLSCPKF